MTRVFNDGPRVQIRTYDNATGSYPSISRIGDTRTGRADRVPFDDTDTVIFLSSTIGLDNAVSYPTLQLEDSKFFRIFSGRSEFKTDLSGANVDAVARKGIADQFVDFYNPGEQLAPFKEDGLFASFDGFLLSGTYEEPANGFNRKSSDFYLTGSSVEDVGLGFNSPLWSKTKIEIDLPTLESTTFGYESENGPFSPMVYYSPEKKRWEKIGFQPSLNLDNQASEEMFTGELSIGFTPGTAMLIGSGSEPYQCRPTSIFGFPYAPKFHATSSQVIDMSQYIDRPFIFEKFVLKADISYSTGTHLYNDTSIDTFLQTPNLGRAQIYETGSTETVRLHESAAIKSFFILNQREGSLSVQQAYTTARDTPLDPIDATGIVVTSSIPTEIQIASGTNVDPVYVSTVRDMVTYGQILTHSRLTISGASGDSSLPDRTWDEILKAGLRREAEIDRTDNSTLRTLGASSRILELAGLDFSQRTIVMSGTVKTTPELEELPTYFFVTPLDVDGSHIQTEWHGGRYGLQQKQFYPDGRSLVASATGTKVTDTSAFVGNRLSEKVIFVLENEPEIPSPYIFLPKDKIILGWQIPIASEISGTMNEDGGMGPGGVEGDGQTMTIHNAPAKLVIYGSQLREGVEFHDTLNQPLTSDAIHESIHYDNPVVDQFDVEPYNSLTGSYISYIITGSITGSSYTEALLTDATPRGKALSNISMDNIVWDEVSLVESRVKRTSKFRNLRMHNFNERFFDTLMPPVQKIVERNGSFVYASGVLNTVIEFGEGSAIAGRSDTEWPRGFPFEPRYSAISRILTNPIASVATKNYGDLSDLGSDIIDNPKKPLFKLYGNRAVTFPDGMRIIGYDSVEGGNPYTPGRVTHEDDYERCKFVYGFGKKEVSGSAGYHRTAVAPGPNATFQSNIAGWRYGIFNALPQYSSTVFRRDRYGNLRDMLEQRLDSKFIGSQVQNHSRNLHELLYLADAGGKGRIGYDTLVSDNNRAESSVVTVVFTVGNEPSDTFSSNLSLEATSSLPYFDDQVKNRGDLPTEIVTL